MRPHTSIDEIKVGLNFGRQKHTVGRLAMHQRTIYFEYDSDFLTQNLNISPLNLPLRPGVTRFDNALFEGLPGVFYDSLPDGWGRLLLDRFMRTQGTLTDEISPLDRLAFVGQNTMGALTFEPSLQVSAPSAPHDLDTLADASEHILAGESSDVLAELIELNGSSAGSRPKVLIGLDASRTHVTYGQENLTEDETHWLVKFANQQDGPDAGAIEYVYALMAHGAGVEMPDTHLFPAKNGAGYFATQRFDRNGKDRLHMHTAGGLLHSDFRTPSLDYEDLLALTATVTRDIRQVEKMYRLAVFNVLSHNRDDHAKNFSFLMDSKGNWTLSPAYDLTFSSGPRGEQSTMVLGEGRDPTKEHLIELGSRASLNKATVVEIIQDTSASLAQWNILADTYGVSQSNKNLIESRLAQN